MKHTPRNTFAQIGRHFTRHLPMEHETALFLLVSFLDFMMTYWVLYPRESGPQFGETNAVARWFLHGWGVKGLLGFKVAICLFILLATQAIYMRRPNAALFVLWLGIGVTSVTVIYSAALFVRHTAI